MCGCAGATGAVVDQARHTRIGELSNSPWACFLHRCWYLIPPLQSPHTRSIARIGSFRWYGSNCTTAVVLTSLTTQPSRIIHTSKYALDMVLPAYLKHLWSLVVARIHLLGSTINICHCCHRTVRLKFHGAKLLPTLFQPLSLSALSQRARHYASRIKQARDPDNGVR